MDFAHINTANVQSLGRGPQLYFVCKSCWKHIKPTGLVGCLARGDFTCFRQPTRLIAWATQWWWLCVHQVKAIYDIVNPYTCPSTKNHAESKLQQLLLKIRGAGWNTHLLQRPKDPVTKQRKAYTFQEAGRVKGKGKAQDVGVWASSPKMCHHTACQNKNTCCHSCLQGIAQTGPKCNWLWYRQRRTLLPSALQRWTNFSRCFAAEENRWYGLSHCNDCEGVDFAHDNTSGARSVSCGQQLCFTLRAAKACQANSPCWLLGYLNQHRTACWQEQIVTAAHIQGHQGERCTFPESNMARKQRKACRLCERRRGV